MRRDPVPQIPPRGRDAGATPPQTDRFNPTDVAPSDYPPRYQLARGAAELCHVCQGPITAQYYEVEVDGMDVKIRVGCWEEHRRIEKAKKRAAAGAHLHPHPHATPTTTPPTPPMPT